MKKISYLVVATFLLSLVTLIPVKGKAQVLSGNCGEDIEIVAVFATPYPGGIFHGLAFDGKNLWGAQYETPENSLHKLGFNQTGEMIVEDTIDVPFSPTGTTFVGKNLFCGSVDPEVQIYKIQIKGKKAGTIKDVIPAPAGNDGDCTGLTFDGEYLWNADFGLSGADAYIHKIDLAGEIFATYYAPGDSPEGLAFDGEFIWHVNWQPSYIYKLDTDGTKVCEWQWSTGDPLNNPIGLTFDGNYLWLSDQGTHKIYKIDIAPSP